MIFENNWISKDMQKSLDKFLEKQYEWTKSIVNYQNKQHEKLTKESKK